MEWLKETFCESPVSVYVVLAAAEIALAAVWYHRRGGRWVTLLVIPPVLALAVTALDALVVTDREEILAASEQIARDLSDGRMDAAEKYLADDVSGFWGSKAAAIAAGKMAFKTYRLGRVKIGGCEIKVTDGEARMRAVTTVSFQPEGNDGPQTLPLTWEIHWVKSPQGWRITRVSRPEADVKL